MCTFHNRYSSLYSMSLINNSLKTEFMVDIMLRGIQRTRMLLAHVEAIHRGITITYGILP